MGNATARIVELETENECLRAALQAAHAVLVQLTNPYMGNAAGKIYFQALDAETAARNALHRPHAPLNT